MCIRRQTPDKPTDITANLFLFFFSFADFSIWIIAAVFCGDEGEREIVLKEAAAAAAFLSIENSKLKSGSEMMAVR